MSFIRIEVVINRIPVLSSKQIALLALLCGAAFGCGTETYESRLAETAKYFTYLEKLNENLAQNWRDAGIEYRVPVQFRSIPAPQPEKDAEGNLVPPTSDPRRPEFLEGGLPGLVGAWQAPVQVQIEQDGERQNAQVPAYLFVLSNFSLFADGKIEQATEFGESAVKQISGGLSARLRDQIPVKIPSGLQGTNYQLPKPFTKWELDPKQDINGVKYTASIYRHQNGDMVAIVFALLPRNITNPPLLNEKIILSLETLSVSSQQPRRGTSAGSPGAPRRSGPDL